MLAFQRYATRCIRGLLRPDRALVKAHKALSINRPGGSHALQARPSPHCFERALQRCGPRLTGARWRPKRRRRERTKRRPRPRRSAHPRPLCPYLLQGVGSRAAGCSLRCRTLWPGYSQQHDQPRHCYRISWSAHGAGRTSAAELPLTGHRALRSLSLRGVRRCPGCHARRTLRLAHGARLRGQSEGRAQAAKPLQTTAGNA